MVSGFKALVKKELADHLSSYRFLILMLIIIMVSLVLVYMASDSMKEQLQGEKLFKFVFLMLFTSSKVGFSLVEFIAYFGPLIGLMIGFDSINRERNEGTLSKLLAQPIYRDTVINGKYLAGVGVIGLMVVSIIMLITGVGLFEVGVKPGIEEFWRIFIYAIISIVYISLWLAVSILFSTVFRSVATSALASFALWIFFSFFLPFGINALANSIVSSAGLLNYKESLVRVIRIEKILSFTSPMMLYSNATATIIDPLRRSVNPTAMQMGMREQLSIKRFAGPLPLFQSFLIVAPYIFYLVTITIIIFIITYIVFMRQEIRSI